MRILTIVIPDHTQEKLDALHEHYLTPSDTMIQKIVVDRVDDIYDAVILEPERKKAASA